MTLDEAKAECGRYLDYLQQQEEKSLALQKLASDRRAGRCDDREARKRMAAIDGAPTVYDGYALKQAIKVLLEHIG